VDIKGERPASPELSIYGFANGTGTGTERDELEESPFDEDAHSSPPESDGRNHAAAARRQVMRERAAEREAEEAVKSAKATKDREDARLKKAEGKQQTAERRRLADEEESTASKLRSLEVDFRSHFYALRARPIGTDRFGNKVWWLDGCGSAPLVPEHGRVLWGTGRLYVQGADEGEVEWCRLPAEIAPEEVKARRATEEGESRLAPAEWASYDTPDQVSLTLQCNRRDTNVSQLQEFMSWLNPKGIREFHLLKQLRQWLPELEGGMHRRRIAAGLESQPDGEEPSRRARPVRKVAAGGGTVGDVEEGTGYMGWRVSAFGCSNWAQAVLTRGMGRIGEGWGKIRWAG